MKVEIKDGMLICRFRYNRQLVDSLKLAIPVTHRKWDPARKAWLIDPDYGTAFADLANTILGVRTTLPDSTTDPVIKDDEEILEVYYLGLAKSRGGEDREAFGYCGGEWSVVFPERVLREWFGMDQDPAGAVTLYGALGLTRNASQDDIKRAYRRMAMQWHPDRCKDENAGEQFKVICNAYKILDDPGTRARYNAGLALSSHLPTVTTTNSNYGYRAPLRCGLIKATGARKMGRFVVKNILTWDDITDPQGRTLIVSWPKGADMFAEVWV